MSDVNKPENAFPDSMLVVDITLGIGSNSSITTGGDIDTTYWGYFNRENIKSDVEEGNLTPPVGVFSIIKNQTDIADSSVFYWIEYPDNSAPIFIWNVSSYNNDNSYNRLAALFEKDLHITVDGITYALGIISHDGADTSSEHKVINWYKNNAEAQKLSYILKQTGVTKRLYINWK
ncbi:hypothetical protein ABLA30_16030 [Xenorhabdus nematophila]|uniref:DUF7823 domain-containing protein n=1 Tax=Xenorhabdus nematophila TaxID=628 RepID=UPI0032B76DF8